VKSTLFLPNLRFLLSTYFDHDAFMQHASLVLDAPGFRVKAQYN